MTMKCGILEPGQYMFSAAKINMEKEVNSCSSLHAEDSQKNRKGVFMKSKAENKIQVH